MNNNNVSKDFVAHRLTKYVSHRQPMTLALRWLVLSKSGARLQTTPQLSPLYIGWSAAAVTNSCHFCRASINSYQCNYQLLIRAHAPWRPIVSQTHHQPQMQPRRPQPRRPLFSIKLGERRAGGGDIFHMHNYEHLWYMSIHTLNHVVHEHTTVAWINTGEGHLDSI